MTEGYSFFRAKRELYVKTFDPHEKRFEYYDLPEIYTKVA
jgi:hypothetical protein